ncbi:hypothetical protein PMIN03_008997 [Paraphaeosphaeria minitans]
MRCNRPLFKKLHTTRLSAYRAQRWCMSATGFYEIVRWKMSHGTLVVRGTLRSSHWFGRYSATQEQELTKPIERKTQLRNHGKGKLQTKKPSHKPYPRTEFVRPKNSRRLPSQPLYPACLTWLSDSALEGLSYHWQWVCLARDGGKSATSALRLVNTRAMAFSSDAAVVRSGEV